MASCSSLFYFYNLNLVSPESATRIAALLCGNVNISYPFRLKSQPWECGNHRHELDCEKDNRTTLVINHEKFYVQEIFYENSTFRVLYPSLGMDHCSFPLSRFYHDSSWCVRYLPDIYFLLWYFNSQEFWDHYSVMYLVNCSTPVKSSVYVEASRCTNTSSHPSFSYFYFLDSGGSNHGQQYHRPIYLANLRKAFNGA